VISPLALWTALVLEDIAIRANAPRTADALMASSIIFEWHYHSDISLLTTHFVNENRQL
jgi:hypothetical protein